MLTRLRSIWTATDLRNKILFTLALLFIYRVIAHVPVPGIDPATLSSALGKNSSLNQIFSLLSLFSGGSIAKLSIVGLGVYPYITASIVMQLLQPIIPALKKMGTEDGEAGRNRLAQITRYLTIPLAFLQSLAQLSLFASIGAVSTTQFNLLNSKTFVSTLATLITMTAGVMLLVWIGELISENGIGNGISLIILTNILASLPTNVSQLYLSNGTGSSSGSSAINTGSLLSLVTTGAVIAILMYLIVYVVQAARRVPVQYPTKRAIGGRAMMETRQSSFIPIQVNQGGMIPLIFAQSLLLFPIILGSYINVSTNPVSWLKNLFSWLSTVLDTTGIWYPILFFLGVFLFTFFYAEVLWEQQDMADSLRKQGAFIAGVRPGNDTARYLLKILRRVSLGGALFLGVIAVSPYLLSATHLFSAINSSGRGGLAASLIIVVTVVIDTARKVEAQVVMRNYSGFLR